VLTLCLGDARSKGKDARVAARRWPERAIAAMARPGEAPGSVFAYPGSYVPTA